MEHVRAAGPACRGSGSDVPGSVMLDVALDMTLNLYEISITSFPFIYFFFFLH